MRRLGCVLVAVLVLAVGAPMVAAEGGYAPPVDGPVVDRFRPPATPYGRGNRGIDFATEPGEPVRAAADGDVVFAGRVGLTQHVVVLHGDGIRTSYSFLADVDLRPGDHVLRGQPVGRSGTALHFGARAGDDRYLDPEALLAGGPPDVHLVPVEERGRRSATVERRNLLRSLVGVVGAGLRATADGVAWVREAAGEAIDVVERQLRDLTTLLELAVHYAALPFQAYDTWRRAQRFLRSQQGCTPADVAPPPRPSGRRIAVLVAGFGSSSGDAAVLDVDTSALGYADGEVAQFSYAGGQAPGTRSLAGVPTTTYGPDAADGDLREAGERFRDLLESIRAAHPGVPVDVIAHSQGGVVVRWGLGHDGDGRDPRLPVVDHVITLGSPHDGTDLATANAALGTSAGGSTAQVVVRELGGPDGTSKAAAQLAETSDFIDDLGDRPLPEGARVTSIAARGDLVVPAVHASLSGATNVLVPLDGVEAHDRLPGGAVTERELALALADRGPTCRSLTGDLLRSAGISFAEDVAGAAVLAGGQVLAGAVSRSLARRPPSR